MQEVHLNNRLSRDFQVGKEKVVGMGSAGLELWWLVLPLPDSEHRQEKRARVQGLFLVPFGTKGSPRSAALRNSKKDVGSC